MKLLMLPRYGRLGASSRLRSYQYLPWLRREGIDVHVQALLDDRYVSALYERRRATLAVASGYVGRVSRLLAARQFDAVFAEKETLPWLPAAIELGLLPKHVRLVVDYDDAVFHRYDQHRRSFVRRLLGDKLDRVMRRADLVTVGNSYLAERAMAAGAARVERVPTVVDLERYQGQCRADFADGEIVIGWIGSPSTAHYLKRVSASLAQLKARYRVRCIAIGARPDQLVGTPFEAVEWHEGTEVASLHGFDIGIMPLPDAPWERGKCGYKLIQYMACGLPVVASAVGANNDIVTDNENGLLVHDDAGWTEALERLILDASLRTRMGVAGRKRVEAEYCLQVQGQRLAGLLHGLTAA